MSTVGRDQGWGKGPCGSQPQSPGCQQVGHLRTGPHPSTAAPPAQPPEPCCCCRSTAGWSGASLLACKQEWPPFPLPVGVLWSLGVTPMPRASTPCPPCCHPQRGTARCPTSQRKHDTGALSSQATSPRASQIPKSELQPSMAPQTTPSDPKTPRSMGPHSPSPP